MNLLLIKERLETISKQKDLNRYIGELKRLDKDIKLEKLIEWNQTDREIKVTLFISKDKNNIIKDREFVFYFGDFRSLYFGTSPEVIKFYLVGDPVNPGYIDDFMFTEFLYKYDYMEILEELNLEDKDIYIFFSPEYNIVGINHKEGISYYDLSSSKEIDFKKKTDWLKVYMN